MRPILELNNELLKTRLKIKRGDMLKAHEKLNLSKQTITVYMRGEGTKSYIAQALLDFFEEVISDRNKQIA